MCLHFRLFLQACSDKLQREMKEYGFPPVFPAPKEDEEEEESGKQGKEQLPKDPAVRTKKVHSCSFARGVTDTIFNFLMDPVLP